MSNASKIALAASVAVSTGIIGYVHYKQSDDREKLHEGVVRDIERQQRRKLENTYVLQKQSDLKKQLKNLEATEDERKGDPEQTSDNIVSGASTKLYA